MDSHRIGRNTLKLYNLVNLIFKNSRTLYVVTRNLLHQQVIKETKGEREDQGKRTTKNCSYKKVRW